MLIIDSSDLAYYSRTKTFIVNASILESKYTINRLDYEDGKWCLRIKSHKTGNVAKFIRTKELYDSSNNLESVIFRGENNLVDVTLKVINL